MKRFLSLILLLALCLPLTGCRKKEDPYANAPNPIATITMTDGREMHFELHRTVAPNTVANFITLANSGFYDGLEFFRVIPGVLIQSGDPLNNGTGTADWLIRGEFSANGFQNDLSHNRGVLSMARQESSNNSASSQFFIMQGNYPEYDGRFAAFGTAMDEETLTNLDSIASQPVDGYYVPLKRQTVSTVRVNTHGYEYEAETLPLPDNH